MKILTIYKDTVASVDQSPFLNVQKREDGLYDYEGDTFGASCANPDTVMVLPDETEAEVGGSILPEWHALAMPLDTFLRATPAQATADAIGLVMRGGVADGAITDEEILRVAPA